MVPLLVLLCIVSGVHGMAPLIQGDSSVPGQFIVKIKSPELVGAFRQELLHQMTQHWQANGTFGRIDVKFALESDPAVLIMNLDYESLYMVLAHPSVEYVEEDGLNLFDDSDIDLDINQMAAVKGQPPGDWGLDRINQRELQRDGNISFTGDGFGVNIYLIDSGINDLHRDFECRARKAFDVFGSDGRDCLGHGTNVAGVAASKTWGVAKAAMVHSIRMLDCVGRAAISHMVKGIDWVVEHAMPPCVATMSFSSTTSSPTIEGAVKRLAEKGCIPVTAATNIKPGNVVIDACTRTPARSPYAITVAATEWIADEQAYFSRSGPCVDIYAPGDFIRTTAAEGNYKTVRGTSIAVSFVAGVAAIHLGNKVPPEEVRRLILGDATVCAVPNAGRGSPNRLLYTDPGQY